MFLIKCKCGCFFTIKAERLKEARVPDQPILPCPNCGVDIPLGQHSSIEKFSKLNDGTQSVSYIPDNAKITVTFDP